MKSIYPHFQPLRRHWRSAVRLAFQVSAIGEDCRGSVIKSLMKFARLRFAKKDGVLSIAAAAGIHYPQIEAAIGIWTDRRQVHDLPPIPFNPPARPLRCDSLGISVCCRSLSQIQRMPRPRCWGDQEPTERREGVPTENDSLSDGQGVRLRTRDDRFDYCPRDCRAERTSDYSPPRMRAHPAIPGRSFFSVFVAEFGLLFRKGSWQNIYLTFLS